MANDFFFKIHPEELVFDAAIVLYVIFFQDWLLGGESFGSSISLFGKLLLGNFFLLIIVFESGLLLRRTIVRFRSRLWKSLVTATCFLLFLGVAGFNVFHLEMFKRTTPFALSGKEELVTAVLFGLTYVLGSFVSLLFVLFTTLPEKEPRLGRRNSVPFTPGTARYLLIGGWTVLTGFIYGYVRLLDLEGGPFRNIHGAGLITGIFAVLTAFIFVSVKVTRSVQGLSEETRKLLHFPMAFVFPFLLATLFLLFNEFPRELAEYRSGGTKPEIGEKILYLTLTGLLPFRLVVFFQYPLRFARLVLLGGSWLLLFLLG